MRPSVVKANNLGKKYRLGFHHGSDTLRDKMAHGMRKLSQNLFARKNGDGDERVREFWALRNVSFEMEQGQVLGIIGRNGAGKSTLLKLLSRITHPTEGEFTISGRVASLLEVGTGFHPELSGRENIFLNGAILGMKRAEIKSKFDQIVAFAEVEKFIDTPVKRYSSGMYVRLAFSVAAHLEPEILIVDEVLAVGDLEFQKKCLGRMHEVSSGGRTILFVSHNMGAIESMCDRVLVLNEGEVIFAGETKEGIQKYIGLGKDSQSASSVDLEKYGKRIGKKNDTVRLKWLRIFQEGHIPASEIKMGSSVTFEVDAEFKTPYYNPTFIISLFTTFGQKIIDVRTNWEGKDVGQCSGNVSISAEIEEINIMPGRYEVWVSVEQSVHEGVMDEVQGASSITVLPSDVTGHGAFFRDGFANGICFVRSDWRRIA